MGVLQAQKGTALGLLHGVAAYGMWGVLPLYFRAVSGVSPAELLAHRILWSAVLLTVLLTLLGRWAILGRCLRSGRSFLLLLVSTLLLAANWFIYIYAIATGRVLQTSLGYFVLPLFSVILGRLFFRERLRGGQWLALALALVGLIILVCAVGELPWIALALAGSFGLYGLLRKLSPVQPLVGLAVETFLLAPIAAICLGLWTAAKTAAFAQQDTGLVVLLLLGGVVTAIPLLCFGEAAQRLPLSSLGFLQYLTPSLQLLLAVWVFLEPLRSGQLAGFACILIALAIFSLEPVLRTLTPRSLPQDVQPPPSEPVKATS